MADIITEDPQTDVGKGLASACAEAIGEAFAAYHDRYHEITRLAKSRFEQCDWHGLHNDGVERLELYREVVASTVSSLEPRVQEHFNDGEFWGEVKSEYSRLIAGRKDYELAETFFNSVTLRVANDGCIDSGIQYVGTEHPENGHGVEEHAYKAYAKDSATVERVGEMLLDCAFECEFRCLEEDAAQIAEAIERHLQDTAQGEPVESIEVARPLFYRGKGAYIVGRVRTFTHTSPLMICMSNGEAGAYVDAVLLTENEVSIMFSFARSYFHVNTDEPSAIVRFLKTIMPRKPVAELYTQLGYNKHGKTELYRDLMRHLQRSDDKFEIAPGERGMVMIVFTLPSYDVVFKIIKDRFDYPKSTTRQEVRNRYYLVFKHDRGGRLVDAQEFEHLRFSVDRFSPELLDELLSVASNTVSVDGDEVVIKHLYTERRLVPLNLYLNRVGQQAAHNAVVDYGQAIKDLAATNIFPGDILLKNFGVTRHGRVVFYDYDELCLLTECRFREMPESEDPDDYMSSEPWFSVDEADVFPEEMKTFLGLPPELAEIFVEHHGELFTADFWNGLQARHNAGEVLEVLPYKEHRRLKHEEVEVVALAAK